jgi:cell wall-associated NlpC family hydrolase
MRLVAVLTVATLLTACASGGGVPRPFPIPGGHAPGPTTLPAPPDPGTTPPPGANPPATPPAAPAPAHPGTTDGYALSSTALALRGAPYRNGGMDPNGFDCSGFVRYVFGQHGLGLPREVREQYREGQAVDRARLEPGDLVFFSTTAPGASHVGIVIGGDQFVHAPSERGVVRVESLSTQYWAARFIGAKRLN